MCGFAGVVSFGTDRRKRWLAPETRRALADTLSNQLCHRGPDGEGAWDVDDGAIRAMLVHRRLAVIDPMARSDQPMASSDGRLVIAFNGEIYNYRQLRADLSPRPWHTDGDTEVLLAAYERWGPRCVERLEGMFALAIIDRRDADRPAVFLARDSAGEKPLYVAARGNFIAFASELRPLKTLAAAFGERLEVDPEQLAHYLAYGYVSRSIYAGVSRLSPGHVATFTEDGGEVSAYGLPELDGADVRELVQDAVTKRLVADVPVGCLLSGGVDSSVVALCMTRAVGDAKRVRTFSIGFDDDPRYDESRHAAEVARHLGTTHREFRVAARSVDVPALLTKLAGVFGEPFADSSAIPTSILAQHVRQEVTVALGGDGGDELFGGYDRYRALAMSAKLKRMRGVGWMAKAATLLPAGHAKSRLTRAKRFGEALGLDDDARYASYTRLFTPADLARLAPSLPAVPPYPLDAPTYGNDLVAAAAALDRRTYLPDDLLVKLDRCAMLHALEVRAPFMDRRLLRLADSLRGEQLVENGRGKALVRRAFASDLPAAVFGRRKMGFAVPPAVLTSPAMLDLARELLASSTGRIGLSLEANALRQFVASATQSPAIHAQRLYSLVMLALWARDEAIEAPNCA